jgi:hypothetical protein
MEIIYILCCGLQIYNNTYSGFRVNATGMLWLRTIGLLSNNDFLRPFYDRKVRKL